MRRRRNPLRICAICGWEVTAGRCRVCGRPVCQGCGDKPTGSRICPKCPEKEVKVKTARTTIAQLRHRNALLAVEEHRDQVEVVIEHEGMGFRSVEPEKPQLLAWAKELVEYLERKGVKP